VVDQSIAQLIGSRAQITQVLVSIDALTALFERMNMLLRELQEIDLFFRCGVVALDRGPCRHKSLLRLPGRRTKDNFRMKVQSFP
jgi:hypothetical protein